MRQVRVASEADEGSVENWAMDRKKAVTLPASTASPQRMAYPGKVTPVPQRLSSAEGE